MTKRLLDFFADRKATWLCILGGVSSLCFAGVFFLSLRFRHSDGHALRPIREVLALLAVASFCWLAALVIVLKQQSWRTFFKPLQQSANDDDASPNQRRSFWIVFSFALLFRFLLLFSQPIQEIDYYRYLWDGRVLLSGNNPFRYSPKQIEDWQTADAGKETRHALHQLAKSSETVNDVFKRVHHRQVPTVYPPLAQCVFAFSCALSPADAPLWVHVPILKAVLLLFDVGTILVLIGILRWLRLPAVWCLSYAWCPLVIKEIANSAHLDSIAVFFTALFALILIAIWKRSASAADEHASVPRLFGSTEADAEENKNIESTLLANRIRTAGTAVAMQFRSAIQPAIRVLKSNPELAKLALGCAAAACLAFGVLGKTYPLVLLPVLVGFLLPHLRFRVVIPVAFFGMILVLAYAPFLLDKIQTGPSRDSKAKSVAKLAAAKNQIAANRDGDNNPLTGLKTFLSHWQMNDFLFMLFHENLRDPVSSTDRFFVIVPREIRREIHRICTRDLVSMGVRLSGRDPAFLLVQGTMGVLIAGLSLFWAMKLIRAPEPRLLLRGIFLVLVWAWLLNPAQNPWYLLWCLPFMIFEVRRSWFILPATALLYYFRFWLEYRGWSNPAAPNLDVANRMREVFDYGIIWLEYMPFFVLLGLETFFLWRANSKTQTTQNHDERGVDKPDHVRRTKLRRAKQKKLRAIKNDRTRRKAS